MNVSQLAVTLCSSVTYGENEGVSPIGRETRRLTFLYKYFDFWISVPQPWKCQLHDSKKEAAHTDGLENRQKPNLEHEAEPETHVAFGFIGAGEAIYRTPIARLGIKSRKSSLTLSSKDRILEGSGNAKARAP